MTANDGSKLKSIRNQNCVTGGEDHLLVHLLESIERAKKIDIMVAFLMESGVRLLLDDLRSAVDRGVPVRILCGNYMNITQPHALYLLKNELHDRVDLRFYENTKTSFHPKAYLFKYQQDGDIFIGSSNVSKSALTGGIEWNYRIRSTDQTEDYDHFCSVFENLFLNQSILVDDVELKKYSKQWKRSPFHQRLEQLEDAWVVEETEQQTDKNQELQLPYEIDLPSSDQHQKTKNMVYPQPMGAQIEALYELKKAREEGWDKGLVVAATGIGKTYLAAFDSANFSPVLFVAHREEILRQAERTFLNVNPQKTIGYFSNQIKQTDCDILLATVQTLGKPQYLQEAFFDKNAFEYIVLDEFHHAVADSYARLIDYFAPKFFLGLTATPERLDNKDVFALCDYNVVYEVRLKEAIHKGWLVPFRYYGIYDDTDYSEIDFRNGKYNEKQLEKKLGTHKRAELIYRHYDKYLSKRALGFCTSRQHAVFMSRMFTEYGIPSTAVVSGNDWTDEQRDHTDHIVMDRKEAVIKLNTGEVKVIFSVDMFNEGLDVPAVDMVLFLRPTESPTVFLQQLGRGLRRNGQKKYLNVLDFIGNYKNASLIPFFLTGDVTEYEKRKSSYSMPQEEAYPEGCFVNFDFQIIDVFKKMEADKRLLVDKVIDEFNRIHQEYGKRPTRVDLYTYMDSGLLSTMRSGSKANVFKDYLSFLQKRNLLDEKEMDLLQTDAHSFLKEMENTSMSKMYKMPILLAFYNKGNMKRKIDDDDIYHSFKEFYEKPSNSIDMIRDKSTKNFRNWEKQQYISLARRNPIRFLQESAPAFFHEENKLFCLSEKLEPYLKHTAFVTHFKDIIDYRTRRFYKERLEKREV